MARKDDIKKLKGPDQFQVKALESVDWLTRHSKEIAIVVGVVLVAALGSSIYAYVKSGEQEKRLKELGEIELVYEQEEEKAQSKRDELQKQLTEIELKLSPPAVDPAATTATAQAPKPEDAELAKKQSELQEQIGKIEADHSGARDKYKAFYEKYKTTPEGWHAGVTAASLYLQDDKSAEAKALLEDVTRLTKNAAYFYQTQTRLTLAAVHEDLGEFDQALVIVNELEGTAAKDKELLPQVLLAKGRLLYLKNQPAEAKTVLQSLIEAHDASPEADKARTMALLLN